MKFKSIVSSLVLGAAMLTLSACDSGGPSAEDISASIFDGWTPNIEPIDLPEIEPLDLSGIEQSPRELEQLSAEIERSGKDFEQKMADINAEFEQSISEINLDI